MAGSLPSSMDQGKPQGLVFLDEAPVIRLDELPYGRKMLWRPTASVMLGSCLLIT